MVNAATLFGDFSLGRYAEYLGRGALPGGGQERVGGRRPDGQGDLSAPDDEVPDERRACLQEDRVACGGVVEGGLEVSAGLHGDSGPGSRKRYGEREGKGS